MKIEILNGFSVVNLGINDEEDSQLTPTDFESITKSLEGVAGQCAIVVNNGTISTSFIVGNLRGKFNSIAIMNFPYDHPIVIYSLLSHYPVGTRIDYERIFDSKLPDPVPCMDVHR